MYGWSRVTDFSPAAKISSPNALGTKALLRISSAPLPSFRLLSSASKFRKHRISHDLRIRAGTSSTSTRPLRVRIRSNARTCAPAGKRARAWHAGTSMQSPKQGVALRMALRAADLFWQARYYDFNVWSECKFVEKLRYIHRNPVNRGLVVRPEDWVWSSFRHYLSGEEGPVGIESRAGIIPMVRVRLPA